MNVHDDGRRGFGHFGFLLGAVAAGASGLVAGRSADAAEIDSGDAARITAVARDSDLAVEFIRETIGISGSANRPQAESLIELVDVFLIGVAPARPLRIDLLTGPEPSRSRLSVPVANFRNFRNNNLVPAGIPVARIAGEPGMYRLGGQQGAAFDGYMRYLDEEPRTAEIVEAREDLDAAVGGPLVLAAGFDGAVRLESDAAGVEARRLRYVESRERTLNDLRRREDETAAEFRLRKLLTGQRLEDYEQFYAEASRASADVGFDFEADTATVDVSLAAHEGTELASAIADVPNRPSLFGGVTPVGGAIARGRLTWIVTPSQRPRWQAALDAYRPVVNESLESDTTDTVGVRKATDAVFGHLDRVIAGGFLDGVFDWGTDGGAETLVCAFRTVDAASLTEAVRAVTATSLAEIVGEEGVGDTITFELRLDRARFDRYAETFGSREMTLEVGPEVSVIAAGSGRAARAKAVLAQVGGDDPRPGTLIDFSGRLSRLVPLARSLRTGLVEEETREMLDESLAADDDTVEARLVSDGETVEGGVTARRGLLGFVGRLLARFARENL